MCFHEQSRSRRLLFLQDTKALPFRSVAESIIKNTYLSGAPYLGFFTSKKILMVRIQYICTVAAKGSALPEEIEYTKLA